MEYDFKFHEREAGRLVGFRSAENSGTLEILRAQGDEQLEINYSLGTLTDEQIPAWACEEIKDDEDVSTLCRLLIIPQCYGTYRSIPMSINSFASLSEVMELPRETFRLVSHRTPMFFSFAGSDFTRGLILRNRSAHFWEFVFISVYDDRSRSTRAVCWGLSAAENRELVGYIAAAKETAHHFFFLPILLVDIGVYKLARFVESRCEDKRIIQDDLGMDDYFDVRRYAEDLTQRLTSMNLNAATERLTSLSQSAVGLSGYCKAQMQFVLQLEAYLKEYESKSFKGEDELLSAFKRRLAFLRESISSIQTQLDNLQEAIGSLVQTVYSLIAQKDSQHSLSSAQSAHNTSLMTARDSTDMRIIAAVTLIFLPGTFTATLFSTSFFSFQTPDHPRVVSHWIWLYVAVTIGLMASVIAAWAGWSFLEHSRTERLLNIEHDTLVLLNTGPPNKPGAGMHRREPGKISEPETDYNLIKDYKKNLGRAQKPREIPLPSVVDWKKQASTIPLTSATGNSSVPITSGVKKAGSNPSETLSIASPPDNSHSPIFPPKSGLIDGTPKLENTEDLELGPVTHGNVKRSWVADSRWAAPAPQREVQASSTHTPNGEGSRDVEAAIGVRTASSNAQGEYTGSMPLDLKEYVERQRSANVKFGLSKTTIVDERMWAEWDEDQRERWALKVRDQEPPARRV